MRKRNYLLIIPTLALLIAYACSKENESSSSIDSSKLTVNDAKTYFEVSIQKSVSQKSLSRSVDVEGEAVSEFTGLTPVNFTPKWNSAVVTADENTSSVNIPIATIEKYYAQEKSSKEMITLAQKMVVSQESTGEMTCQIVTLLPENGKSSESQINSFNLFQENTGYSGIVIYTTLEGTVCRIERYEAGNVLESANVCEEHHEGETMNDLLERYDFFKNDAVAMYSSSEGGGGSTGPYPFCTYCGKMLQYCDCTHHNNPNKNYWDCPICFPTLTMCTSCKQSTGTLSGGYCSRCGRKK